MWKKGRSDCSLRWVRWVKRHIGEIERKSRKKKKKKTSKLGWKGGGNEWKAKMAGKVSRRKPQSSETYLNISLGCWNLNIQVHWVKYSYRIHLPCVIARDTWGKHDFQSNSSCKPFNLCFIKGKKGSRRAARSGALLYVVFKHHEPHG